MALRWIEHLRATLGGYFWLPCPNCGRMFSGRESHQTLWIDVGSGRCTCNHPICVAQVDEKNARFKEAKALKEGLNKQARLSISARA